MIAKFNKKGQTMVEYALIVALIGVLLIAGLSALKTGVSSSLSNASAQL